MRLDISIRILLMQAACGLQLFVRAGDRKTGSDHITVTPFPMPSFDQRTAFGLSPFGRVGQTIRRITVHQHFSGHHTHIIFRSNRKKGIDGCGMHSRICHTGRRPVPEQFLHEKACDPFGMFRRRESLFGRESIVIQPLKQLFSIHPDNLGLRIMDMRIDKARHYQLAGIVDPFTTGVAAFEFLERPAIDYDPFLHDQRSVGEIPESVTSV